MAIERLIHDGYGMLERNRVDPVNMESQCELDAKEFPNGAEVGTIVTVNKAAGKVQKYSKNEHKMPAGILANSERLYDQYHQGLKNYHVEGGKMASVLFLEKGHTFTTNTVCYEKGGDGYTDEAALVTALKAAGETPVYAGVSADGIIQIWKTDEDTTRLFQVVKYTTMPDGQHAVKFIVVQEENI